MPFPQKSLLLGADTTWCQQLRETRRSCWQLSIISFPGLCFALPSWRLEARKLESPPVSARHVDEIWRVDRSINHSIVLVAAVGRCVGFGRDFWNNLQAFSPLWCWKFRCPVVSQQLPDVLKAGGELDSQHFHSFVNTSFSVLSLFLLEILRAVSMISS